MPASTPRGQLRHFEAEGGVCHVTWRLRAAQAPLAPEEGSCVLEIMRRGTASGCRFHAAVVMDDHVHALFEPGARMTAARLARSWKSASSRTIIRASLRTAPLRQADHYQRRRTSARLIPICVEHIRANPGRRGPGVEGYRWVLP